MFSLFGKVQAEYKKLFFELNINGNNGDDIDLYKYRNKGIPFYISSEVTKTFDIDKKIIYRDRVQNTYLSNFFNNISPTVLIIILIVLVIIFIIIILKLFNVF